MCQTRRSHKDVADDFIVIYDDNGRQFRKDLLNEQRERIPACRRVCDCLKGWY
ncbi:MAG: hypothetical protein Fues2KO_34500 [Fuerstiella sp.]